MDRNYFVYIMASFTRVIYVGMTNDLQGRVRQHRNKVHEGFTNRYNCTHLVYFEVCSDPMSAITREKEIKRWRREKKIALIESLNPSWRDLWNDFLD